MMDIDSFFSEDYLQSRRAFLAAAREAGATIASYINPVGTGPAGEELVTDVACIGARKSGAAVVVCSGTHGIEGYCGSGIQTGLLRHGIAEAAPKSVSIYLVHALNPHGFAYNRRVNEDNIDLNRNFIDFEQPGQNNEDYDNLHKFLAPEIWPEIWDSRHRIQVDSDIAGFINTYGMDKFTAAVTGGQWHHADGLFYGGQAPTWSNKIWHQIIQDHLGGHSDIAAIDLHTGLGDFGYGEPIYIASSEDNGDALARKWYGDEVTGMDDGTSCSAPIKGALLSALTTSLPDRFILSIALEFGTRPADVVLDALRADNWLHTRAGGDSPLKDDIVRAMKAAFCPDDRAWKEKIWHRGHEITVKALKALESVDD